MKIIKILLIALFFTPAYAEMYKCKVKGKISYQDTACQAQGNLFKKKPDISIDQQKAALARLNDQLVARRKNKDEAKKRAEIERSIRAKEENARANIQNAKELERNTAALERNNALERRRARQVQNRFFKSRQLFFRK